MTKRLLPAAPGIINAEYIAGYEVLVTFDNGEKRIWNGYNSMHSPSGLQYSSPSEFRKFKFNKGFLQWGNESDGSDHEAFSDSVYDFSFPCSTIVSASSPTGLPVSYEIQWDELKKHSLETLELLAADVYEQGDKKKPSTILHNILFHRWIKLNQIFEWNNESKQKFLKVNKKFMQVFDKAYNEALLVAYELENRIIKKDEFIKDYEIEITIHPYMNNRFYDDKGHNIGYVLSEPASGFYPINHSFGHSSYDHEINGKPLYLDKTLNWNHEYFGDIFKDDYICLQIHELLDTHMWSFTDILNIKKIMADVEVIHQGYKRI